MTLGSRPSVSVAHELPPGVLPGSQEPRGKGVRWRGLVACGMSPPRPGAPQESAKLVCGKGWNEDAWDVPCGARCGGTSRVHGPREASPLGADPSPRCPPALEQGRPMRSSSTDAVTRSGPRRRIARPRLVPALHPAAPGGQRPPSLPTRGKEPRPGPGAARRRGARRHFSPMLWSFHGKRPWSEAEWSCECARVCAQACACELVRARTRTRSFSPSAEGRVARPDALRSPPARPACVPCISSTSRGGLGTAPQ